MNLMLMLILKKHILLTNPKIDTLVLLHHTYLMTDIISQPMAWFLTKFVSFHWLIKLFQPQLVY